MSALVDIATEDLVTETDFQNAAITVRMRGCAETGVKTMLDAYLSELHAEAVKTRISEVVVDMRRLEFMNSACFKTFVKWIGALQDSPRELQYKIRFLAAENKRWQGRSLGALASLAVDLVSIEAQA